MLVSLLTSDEANFGTDYYQEYRGTSYQDERVNSSRDTTHLKTQSKTGTIKRPREQIHKCRWRRQCASHDRWTADEMGEGAGNFNNLVQQPDPQNAISSPPDSEGTHVLFRKILQPRETRHRRGSASRQWGKDSVSRAGNSLSTQRK